jgi:competence protein ComEC
VVGGVTMLVVVLWRWRWFRVAAGAAVATALVCLLAWWVSQLGGT